MEQAEAKLEAVQADVDAYLRFGTLNTVQARDSTVELVRDGYDTLQTTWQLFESTHFFHRGYDPDSRLGEVVSDARRTAHFRPSTHRAIEIRYLRIKKRCRL
jgi:hypothetical protein